MGDREREGKEGDGGGDRGGGRGGGRREILHIKFAYLGLWLTNGLIVQLANNNGAVQTTRMLS